MENGQVLTKLINFKATYEGRDILVAHYPTSTSGGHGESSMTGRQPLFIDPITLEEVAIPNGAYLSCDVPEENIK